MLAAAIPFFALDDDVLAGGELSRRGIEGLARAGVRAIVDQREEGEHGQVLSPNVAATWAHACDLEYRRASCPLTHLRSALVEPFLRALAESSRPVYVQSARGLRAAAFLTLKLALERDLDAGRAFERTQALGWPALSPELADFVRDELRRRGAGRTRNDR
jgi:protein tyrosine phosphatase (PTP) superfamily phosphohydrolase (DUF442 family)